MSGWILTTILPMWLVCAREIPLWAAAAVHSLTRRTTP